MQCFILDRREERLIIHQRGDSRESARYSALKSGDKDACAQSSVSHGFGAPGGFSVQGGKYAKGKGAESDFYYNHSCQHIIDTVNGKVPEMLVNVLLDQREGSHLIQFGSWVSTDLCIVSCSVMPSSRGKEFSVALNLLL